MIQIHDSVPFSTDDEVCAAIRSVPAHFADDAFRILNKLNIVSPLVFTGAGNVAMKSQGVCVVKKGTGAATQVTLPARAVAGDFAFVKDGKGDAGANNITIVPDGTTHNTTIDGAANFVMSANYAAVILMHNGSEWSMLGSYT